MSAIPSIFAPPQADATTALQYRDAQDDALVARARRERFIANWIATPTILATAIVAVCFYFLGTSSLVWATACCVHSIPQAAAWFLGSFAFFGIGVALMLLADRLERTYC